MSEAKDRIRDLVPSLLRTGIPSLWGLLLASITLWVAGHLPASIAEPLTALLNSPVVTELLVALCILAWYFLWRFLEPLIPDWAARLVLGSSAIPLYFRYDAEMAEYRPADVLNELDFGWDELGDEDDFEDDLELEGDIVTDEGE